MTPPAQYMPPGARGKFKPELMTAAGWLADVKLDGDRRIAQFTPEGVRFTGRRVSDVDGLLVEKTDRLPHLNAAVPALNGTVLDGEIIVDQIGARSKDVTSIMGSKAEDAIAKQRERGWLVYVVFDCLFFQGRDVRGMRCGERRILVKQAVEAWGNSYARQVPAVCGPGLPEELLSKVFAIGGEGIILKRLDSKYGDEKAWVKVKREFTEDVVITGFDEPEAVTEKIETYKDADGVKRKRVLETSTSRLAANGWIGAIRFGQYRPLPYGRTPAPAQHELIKGVWHELVECGSCSGMDDALRAELSANREKNLGRVIEVLANEREPTGRFRHPRFVGFRDDKNATDCVWGQR